jgi:hypothetical protein
MCYLSFGTREFQPAFLPYPDFHLDSAAQVFDELQVLLRMFHLFPAAQHRIEGMLRVCPHRAQYTFLAVLAAGAGELGETPAGTALDWNFDCLVGGVML